jgi:hypothetical protein
MIYRWLGLSLCLCYLLSSPPLPAAMGPGQFFLPQRHDVPLSPRTRIGRKNLRYEYDLHPANVFRHLEVVEKHEKKFKLKRRIKMFRDDIVFQDDI